MNYLISFFIFCLVLFLYLHIYYQLKTSNDLEVFTIQNPSKDKLEEICYKYYLFEVHFPYAI